VTNTFEVSPTSFHNALIGLGIDPIHADRGFRAEHPFVVAVLLAMMGIRVFPTKLKTKIPCIREWQHRASTNPTDLAPWQRRFNPNWSALTGRDNNLVILDIDGERGRADLARLEGEFRPLPKTIRCNSGRIDGGFHLWLRPPDGVDDLRNQQPLPGTKIDVRAWHGYAVLAGSLHKSGARYSWAPGCAPDEIELAECPPDWWAWLPKKESKVAAINRNSGCRSRGANQDRLHDPSSLLIGDGAGFGGFQNPIYKNAIQYFLKAGPEAPPETIIEILRELIIAAPKDHGRDVSRYLSGPDLPRIVERAREFVNEVQGF
jgi:hypothetical protein